MGLFKALSGIGKTLFGAGGGGGVADSLSGLATGIGNMFSSFSSGNAAAGGGIASGVAGAAGNVVDKATKAATTARDTIKLKKEISEMLNPVGAARKKGIADRAYQDALYPGTSQWSRIGSNVGGISGAAMAADASVQSSRVGARAPNREQDRQDKLFKQNYDKLGAEVKQIIENTKNMAERTKSEIWVAKFAAMRELVAALPYDTVQFAALAKSEWLFELMKRLESASKGADIQSIMQEGVKGSQGIKGKGGFSVTHRRNR